MRESGCGRVGVGEWMWEIGDGRVSVGEGVWERECGKGSVGKGVWEITNVREVMKRKYGKLRGSEEKCV